MLDVSGLRAECSRSEPASSLARSPPIRLSVRVVRRNTRFRAAVRQRDRDRGYLNFGEAVVSRDPDLLRRVGREIHNPALYICAWPGNRSPGRIRSVSEIVGPTIR